MAVHSKPPIFGFYYEITTSSWTVEFPYWMAVLGTGSAAAAPWFRYRFTLRTLLIATTLVALVLGLLVWTAR
jgi:hypothetical protein